MASCASPEGELTSFPLNSGVSIPSIGFGTWRIPKEKAKAAVLSALEAGYRGIDCASVYGNEKEVGEAIAEAISRGIITRASVFVTTKVFNNCHGDRARASLERSLANLGLEYVDLLLVHWPFAFRDFELPVQRFINNFPNPEIIITEEYLDTWKEFEAMQRDGLTKSIGVSNFTVEQLQDLLAHSVIPPAVNQIEIHPYLSQEPLVDFCQKNGVVPEAYCPLVSGDGAPNALPLVDLPALASIGASHGAVVLRWMLQRGIVPLPRSQNPDHIRDNYQIFRFQLSPEEMAAVSSLNVNHRTGRGWIKGHYF